MYNEIVGYAIDLLSKDDYTYLELVEVLAGIYKEIAPKINVGHVEFEVASKQNIYSQKEVVFKKELYKRPDYNEDSLLEYKNGIKGTGQLIVRFHSMSEFSEEEKKCISRLNYLFSRSLKQAKQLEIIGETPFLDPLTGYYNTVGIHRYIGMLCARDTIGDYDTVFFNIKDCGALNRLCGGIQFGDILVRQFADIIHDSLEKDEVLARHGGDNFTILVKKENTQDILDLLKGIRVSAVIKGKPIETVIESVIGYYENKPNDDMYTVMDCAQTAMVTCKKIKNVNVYKYNEELRDRVTLFRRVKQVFPQAMQDGRIVPFYQPKVDAYTNELHGSEALCRWIDPDGVTIPPAVFIKALEEEGSICALDFCILNKVCEDIKKQISLGLSPVPVSVNFSKYHFLKRDVGDSFVNQIIDTINSYGIDPRYIEVEFTESGKVEDYIILKEIVGKLHDVGIKVAIDDYGTGYSSLQLLESVPFDTIKMDKSFADSIGTVSGNIVFTYTTEMMRKLGKDIVYEGVENQSQIEFLRAIKCNIIQGYYYDKPLTYDEYISRLENKNYKKL